MSMNEEQQIPILSLWGHLLVPLQGDISDRAAEDLVPRVLDRVCKESALGVIIDVSGVWMVDSHLCALLAKLVQAFKLMGAGAVVSGLSPEIVTTLMEMGFDLKQFSTTLTLEAALEPIVRSRASSAMQTQASNLERNTTNDTREAGGKNACAN
jgi:rsbT antagonist protein RsbS